MTKLGRSLELFFVDGRVDGMLIAEVFNWTNHVLRTPRTQIKQALSHHLEKPRQVVRRSNRRNSWVQEIQMLPLLVGKPHNWMAV